MVKYKIVKEWNRTGVWQQYVIYKRCLGFLWLRYACEDTLKEAEGKIERWKTNASRRREKPEVMGYYD